MRFSSPESGPITRRLLLSWPDYDFLSRGAIAPREVAARLAGVLAEHAELHELKARIDAAEIRRRYPEADALFRPEEA